MHCLVSNCVTTSILPCFISDYLQLLLMTALSGIYTTVGSTAPTANMSMTLTSLLSDTDGTYLLMTRAGRKHLLICLTCPLIALSKMSSFSQNLCIRASSPVTEMSLVSKGIVLLDTYNCHCGCHWAIVSSQPLEVDGCITRSLNMYSLSDRLTELYFWSPSQITNTHLLPQKCSLLWRHSYVTQPTGDS